MPLTLSFGAGGWIGGCYHLGVVKAFRECLDLSDVHASGCSAGAYAAVSIFFKPEVSVDELFKNFTDVLEKLPTIPFMAENSLRQLVSSTLSSGTLNNSIFNNLYLSVSRFGLTSLTNEIRTKFNNWYEIEDSVIESSMIPFIIGVNLKYTDGWLTKNILKFNSNTLIINFITCDGDITPSGNVNLMYCFIKPSTKECERMYDMGYKDAKRYLKKIYHISKYIQKKKISNN